VADAIIIKRLNDYLSFKKKKDEATVQSKQHDAVDRMQSKQDIHQSAIITLEI